MSHDRLSNETPAAVRRFALSVRPGVRRMLRVLLPALFWLAVWQGASLWVAREMILSAWRAGDGGALLRAVLEGKELLLPGPALTFHTLFSLAVEPAFWQATLLSLLRIFTGFTAGAVLGGGLAVLTSAFPWADTLLSPAIRVIRTVPVASFIILILLWVRTGLVPCVISALMALPVVWGNVQKGFSATDPLLLEMARAYRFGRFKTLRLVHLPAVLPHFTSGCTTALGLAWKAGVAAEVLCQPKQAVGTQIYHSKVYLETPALFAWTGVVIVLSLVLEYLVQFALERRRGVYPWR